MKKRPDFRKRFFRCWQSRAEIGFFLQSSTMISGFAMCLLLLICPMEGIGRFGSIQTVPVWTVIKEKKDESI